MYRAAQPRGLALLAMLATAILFASCTAVGQADVVCDNVANDPASCPDAPTFEGTTCEGLATEWGAIVDQRVVAVIEGPAVAGGAQRSARAHQAVAYPTFAVLHAVRSLGLVGECKPDEFLRAGERMFSDKLRSGVGAILYDGEPVATYDDWLAETRSLVDVLEAP